MHIGNLILPEKVIQAPLAGVADVPFRLMAKRFGAALVYTEMVSAEGVLRGNIGTLRLLDFTPEERPIGVQLFGAEFHRIRSACKKINPIKPDLIDLNCGCPVRKVVQKNGGAALLKDLELLKKIVAGMVDDAEVPVTVKTRSGWDQDHLVAVRVAKIAEEYGAAAVTVHPRTQREKFSNRADWSIITSVKQEVKIPVIGSGDLFSPQDVKNMLDQTGCDAVMIGRGTFGNPWIFSHTNHLLKHGSLLPEPSIPEKIGVCLEHAKLSVERYGEEAGIKRMRKHMVWYTRGMAGGRELRRKLFTLKTFEQIDRTFQEYLLRMQKLGLSTTLNDPQLDDCW